MHTCVIHKLGPIDHIEISQKQFMVLTGSQASGKSTVAKVIYFFRTIKDDMLSLYLKLATDQVSDKGVSGRTDINFLLVEKFVDMFGSSSQMDPSMYIRYYFDPYTFIQVSILDSPDNNNTKSDFSMMWSENIERSMWHDFMDSNYSPHVVSEMQKRNKKAELTMLFHDAYDTIYIPAGRSLITLLATQLNYIYSTMSDAQKRTIDLCTRGYLETILRIRPEFEKGLFGLESANRSNAKNNEQRLRDAKTLIQKILKGDYNYHNGDERLEIAKSQYVKINYASSGQQEVVWILNLLFYYLLQGKPTFVIVEEPESNLFPEAQKYVSELVALFYNEGNQVLVTTHSPYVLGSINNLLYAGGMPESMHEQAQSIVRRDFWIAPSQFASWFMCHGEAMDCMDHELGLIQNEMIDEISQVINNEYDALSALRTRSDGAGD